MKKQHWPGMYRPKLFIDDDMNSSFGKIWIPDNDEECSPLRAQPRSKIKLDNKRSYGVVCETSGEVEFIIRQKRAYRYMIDQLAELNKGWRPTFASDEMRGFFLYDHVKKEVFPSVEKGSDQKLPACEYFRPDISVVTGLKSVNLELIALGKWGIYA